MQQAWQSGRVTLDKTVSSVVVEGEMSGGIHNDFAMDDIVITIGNCGDTPVIQTAKPDEPTPVPQTAKPDEPTPVPQTLRPAMPYPTLVPQTPLPETPRPDLVDPWQPPPKQPERPMPDAGISMNY